MSEELSANSVVKKNANGFSFVKEIINEVNNNDFKQGVKDFYEMLSTKSDKSQDNGKTYIWTALSAIADDVGGTLYQNILNYIQNVSDIDTCSIKALQSLIQILGTKYSVLNCIDDIPLELRNQLEVFSMRRECLVDTNFVQQQLVDALSDSVVTDSPPSLLTAINYYRQTSLSSDSRDYIHDQLSTNAYIDSKVLDAFISSTYQNTIMHYLTLTYDQLENDFPIYQILSDNILLSSFVLPNKYKDKMDAYKTKWNIPISFQPEDEMQKIEAGISSYENYTLREQELLDIEKRRESDPYIELQPLTRYAYFKERKVKDYFKFIEDWYNQSVQQYNTAKEYPVDKTYIDITDNKNSYASSLLIKNPNGSLQLQTRMVKIVVNKLLDITHRLQDVREYLKSHAQRTYMKGTFLLISYVVNEYLKQNVYPALSNLQERQTQHTIGNKSKDVYELSDLANRAEIPLDLDFSNNHLELIEYVDQTQYFNISTDIEQDALSIDSPQSIMSASTLNGKFWNSGSTTNGNSNNIDSTSILRQQDKSMLVLSKSFSLQQIEDFYINVLGASKSIDIEKDKRQQYIYNFLSSVFASGADDSWWHNEHKKVMATLSDQTHTIDIDNYLDALSAAYKASNYVLSSFTPIENTSVRQQLEDALQQYKDLMQAKFDDFEDNLDEFFKQYLNGIDDAISQLEQMYAEFENTQVRANQLFAIYSTSTPDFKATGEYVSKDLNSYVDHVRNIMYDISSALRTSIISQVNMLQAIYIKQLKQLQSYCTTEEVLDATRLSYIGNLEIDNKTLSLSPFSKCLTIYMKTIGELAPTSITSNFYEDAYNNAYNVLTKLRASFLENSARIKTAIRAFLNKYIATLSLDGFNDLSSLLSSHDFYNYTFNIIGCPTTVSSLLDYSNDEWYKYKKKLFLKYTGQDMGDTPYYYLENQRHPSYQIHPCLSNFVEKINFSYPIKNLGSIADDVLKQEAATLAEKNISTWLSNGYLVDAWKNPLVCNSDYAVRYEQANHVDAELSDNSYFGWDGFIHPEIYSSVVGENPTFDRLVTDKNIFSGQNFTSDDKNLIFQQINPLLTMYPQLSGYDIKQYGLDWYGNSYILLSGADGSKFNNTLWFRRKNFPLPCLAFAFSKSSDSENILLSDFSNAAGFSIGEGSNTKMKDVSCTQILNNLYTPIVDDFTFSNDKTIMLMNCIILPNKVGYIEQNENTEVWTTLHGIIKQNYTTKKDNNANPFYGTKTYFLQDSVTKREFLDRDVDAENKFDSSWNFAGWFSQDGQIGSMYLSADPADSTKLGFGVLKYYKNDNLYHRVISADIATPNRKLDSNCKCVADCSPAGKIEIAYDVKNIHFTATQESMSLSNQYFGRKIAAEHLSDYCDLWVDDTICTKPLRVYGDSIFEEDDRYYKLMRPAGFIMAISSITLSNNDYLQNTEQNYDVAANELERNGVLKFQLAVPEAAANAGIDFKFVCPIRQIEGYRSLSGNDNFGYHYGTASCNLSGVVNSFRDVHFLESVYNQYVATMNDEQYYELTDPERLARKSPDKTQQQADFDYLQLAHYDVHKYLSALKSEEQYKEKNEFIGELPLSAKSAGIVQPFMMLSSAIPTTYMSGYYIISANECQAAFRTNRATAIKAAPKSVIELGAGEQLEVSWLRTTNGIKLDFNSKYYIQSGLDNLLSNLSQKNERNRLNIFLNLDRPGEVGILNTWKKVIPANNNSSYIEKINSWLIKNISDDKPKFLLSKINNASKYVPEAVAGVSQTTLGASSNNNLQNTVLLAAEDVDAKLISFE